MPMRRWLATVVLVGLVTACSGGGAGSGPGTSPPAGDAPQKIIIDSDYNTMYDDGQLGVMAAQLQAQRKVQLLGISVVTGNYWQRQEVTEALKSVERLGIGDRVGVYAGTGRPLNHDLPTVQAELAAGAGGPDTYLGAWSTGPEPTSDADLKAPSDGFAQQTKVQPKSAVDFIVDSVKANPHEVTILAVGPLTNIAQAVQRNPEILPLIKQIIHMGGAFDVPGGTTKSAEFNWYFDPDATQLVLRQPIPQVVLPLDVTNTVSLTKPVYDRIAHPAKPTVVTDLFKEANGLGFSGTDGFENNPSYTQNIWDTLTLAYLIDPTYATETVERYVDVVAKPGAADNGHAIGYTEQPAGPPLQKVQIVKKFDNARFFELYVDLLTRPVPVQPG